MAMAYPRWLRSFRSIDLEHAGWLADGARCFCSAFHSSPRCCLNYSNCFEKEGLMLIRWKHLLGLLAFLVFPLVFVTTTHTAEVQTYDITDIGPLGGDETSIATGINRFGDVIGISIDEKGRSTAFFWRNGKIKKIG